MQKYLFNKKTLLNLHLKKKKILWYFANHISGNKLLDSECKRQKFQFKDGQKI